MALYENLRDGTVKRLLDKYGFNITLKKKSGDTFDDETGGVTGGTTKSYTLRGISTKYVKAEQSGTNVKTRDLQILVGASGLTVEPTTSDRVVIGGLEHDIVNVTPLTPGGTVVLYEMQVRQP